MKSNLFLIDLEESELIKLDGGRLSEFTECLLNVIGAIAAEMEQSIQNNSNWWRAFAH